MGQTTLALSQSAFTPFAADGALQAEPLAGALFVLIIDEFVTAENALTSLTPDSYDAYRLLHANDLVDKIVELFGPDCDGCFSRVIDDDTRTDRVDKVENWGAIYAQISSLLDIHQLLTGILESGEVSVVEPFYREKCTEAKQLLERWMLEFDYLSFVANRDSEAAFKQVV